MEVQVESRSHWVDLLEKHLFKSLAEDIDREVLELFYSLA